MQITTADSKTLADMLGQTLRSGWHVQITMPLDGEQLDRDGEFLRMDGNGVRVLFQGADDPITVDLAYVEGIHIY